MRAGFGPVFFFLLGFLWPVAAAWDKPLPHKPQFYAYRVREDGGIAAFSVGPNGDLAALPYVAPLDEIYPSLDPMRWENEITLLRHPRLPVLYSITLQYHYSYVLGKLTDSHVDYRVRVFGVGASGRLMLRQKMTLPALPRAVSPDGKWLYVPNQNDTLTFYKIGAAGTLRAIGITEGGGTDNSPQAGIADDYGLIVAPPGRFAYRVTHSAMLDSSWTNLERFHVLPSGRLVKGDKGGSPYEISRDDGDDASLRGGDLFFSGDGRTALMVNNERDVWAFAVSADGKLRNGEVQTTKQKRGDGWIQREVGGFDRAGRCVLLLPVFNTPKTKSPFLIVRVVGVGKLRETARFGAFSPRAADAPPITDPALAQELSARPEISYVARLRPDNFIDAFAWFGSDYRAYYARYHALFRLHPDGSVTQEKPWTRLSENGSAKGPIKQLNDEPMLRTVYVEKPHSPRTEMP